MWEKIKTWLKNKLLPWAKLNWLSIGTFILLLIVYGALPTESGLGGLVGIWIAVIIGVLGWRLFKGKKIDNTTKPIVIHNENPPIVKPSDDTSGVE